MTTSVVTVTPDAKVEFIAKLLLDKHVSAVPVVALDGKIVGIVSDTDLTCRVAGWPTPHQSKWSIWLQSPAELAVQIKKAVGQCASDIMTKAVVTIHEDMAVRDIAELLAEQHLRRVPVVKDGTLVGIVSRADLIPILAVSDSADANPSSADQGIRREVVQGVRSHNPHGCHKISALVFDGVVHLWGVVETPEQREASQLIAERIAGVRHVQNHIAALDGVPHDIASVV
jgi:CBS domain-containing protein